jgi:succinate dehydrogenase / fumarate reductase cytochrome b subunit
MADNPQNPVAATRPLSPHLTIYRWPITMMTSISHRATGMALSVGALVLAWWLIAISNGPEGYATFHAVMDTPLGMLVMFGITLSLAFHFLNGVRHLAWDMGYGFAKSDAHRNSVLIFAGSLLIAVAIFALVWTGHGGYLS